MGTNTQYLNTSIRRQYSKTGQTRFSKYPKTSIRILVQILVSGGCQTGPYTYALRIFEGTCFVYLHVRASYTCTCAIDIGICTYPLRMFARERVVQVLFLECGRFVYFHVTRSFYFAYLSKSRCVMQN
jgi:hypothetical protein